MDMKKNPTHDAEWLHPIGALEVNFDELEKLRCFFICLRMAH